MTEQLWCTELQAWIEDAALFDEGVEAARNACVAGASIAAAAITAAAWYDNPLTGREALVRCLDALLNLPLKPQRWTYESWARPIQHDPDEVHVPGFGYASDRQHGTVVRAVEHFAGSSQPGVLAARCRFFLDHRRLLESRLGSLNPAGLCALVFADRGVDRQQAERLFLGWRIGTAIEQAQAARQVGLGAVPNCAEGYVYEGSRPHRRAFDEQALLRDVGLE